jgi:hypothetical protein
MKQTTIKSILLVALLCYVTSNIVYFGFISNYSDQMHSRGAFLDLFDIGIYHYRILGKVLLLKFDDLIDPSGKYFYQSTFYFNTFFLILTGIVLVLLVNLDKAFVLQGSEKYFLLLLIPVVINLTQFEVVPYDVLSYFFLILIAFIFLKYYEKDFILTISSVSLLLILSTLNRESSALSVSFLLAILLFRYGLNKKTIVSMSLFAFVFLATYISLRLLIRRTPPEPLNPLVRNFTALPNILGILFWVVLGAFVHFLSNARENRYLILFFYLISLPYVFVVFRDGVLWEMRLYIPLFLGAIFLSKLDVREAPGSKIAAAISGTS